MSTLFAALGTAGSALDVLEKAMGVVQNNVTNASTPGYVTQTLSLNASPFDPSGNLWGGVRAGATQNARDLFSEQSVWSANQAVGSATQQVASLQALQSNLDISGTGGIPGALNALYSAFSAWSATPSSATAQQQVITAAQGVVQQFNTAASDVATVRSQAGQQTRSVVTQVNQLSSQIASINGQIRQGGQNDEGVQAQLFNNLEQLSNLVDITVQSQSDGTVSVLMNGQIPLVIGQTQTTLNATSVNPTSLGSSSAPIEQIVSSSGQDVTAQAEGGQLGGLLNITNDVIPSLTGGNGQQGSLNELAQGTADTVNNLLASGQTSSGAAGLPIFSYVGGSPTMVASTLSVNPAISASQLAPVAPGPPSIANGIAGQLAQLQNNGTMSNGMTFTDFYSSIASGIGNLESNASQAKQTQTQVLTQAQSSRGEVSGVSLNEQAANLLQFQNAYQASAQVLSTINNTIQYLMQTVQSL